MRRLICLLLLAILPLHAFALQGGLTSQEDMSDLIHEMEHQHGIHHHHADDGTVLYDDSTESIKHVAEYECFQQSVTLPSAALPAPNFDRAADLLAHLDIHLPEGFPEQPQRPPSFLG